MKGISREKKQKVLTMPLQRMTPQNPRTRAKAKRKRKLQKKAKLKNKTLKTPPT